MQKSHPMEFSSATELAEFANALIHSRHNVSPRWLDEPGPSAQQCQDILGTAAAAPDHGKLVPWRFVIVPKQRRELLAEVFGQALLDRDPNASPDQMDSAREKAHRSPFLMLAIARLAGSDSLTDESRQVKAGRVVANETAVRDAERLVSFGCAIQNILLSAHGAGFGTGLTSGQAMTSPRLRNLFSLTEHEQAVCCINIGTATKGKPARLRPDMASYVSSL